MIPQDDPDLTAYLNKLLRKKNTEQQNNTFWFSTLESPGKFEDCTLIQIRILKEVFELKQKEKLNPQESTESRKKFLKQFDWTDTLLTETEKEAIEDILVDYHDIFARHRMDFRMNTEFKVELTPKDDKAVYSQSLPMPIHLKEDLIVELAKMHKFRIITVLPFSKYASLIVAQREPNGKLRLPVDLKKINSLIAVDYTKNNHPVSNLSDAAQHLAAKSLFCKLDCTQAYHCLQMADQRSVEMFAFKFGCRSFAYRRFAQGLSRSLSAFSSFMRDTWTRLSKLTKVLNTWTILEWQPTMLRNLPGTFGQSFAKQDWNWQLKSAHSESDKFNSQGERFHHKKFQHKLGKATIFLTKVDVKKCTAAIPGIREKIQNLYSQDGCKT